MSWIALVILVLCVWLAFKAAGVVVRLALWGVVLLAAYWLLAPLLGWPRPF